MRILSLSSRVASYRSRLADKFTLPERFKGTIIDRWSIYWRSLCSDYGEVLWGVVKEVRNKPRKAAIIGGVAYATYASSERNPGEEVFIRSLRHWNNELITVTPELQNPVAVEYLRGLEEAVNHNKMRTLSLGLFTILWVDLFDADDCTYPAVCEYTTVGIWNFHQRVIDVGFWNRFWRLQWNMRNYDVNYL